MSALLNLSNEVNAIHLTFIEKLNLTIQSINIGTQKIDDIIFEIYGMVIAVISVIDQIDKIKLFKKIFLMANVSPGVVFVILFQTLSDANINFSKKKF